MIDRVLERGRCPSPPARANDAVNEARARQGAGLAFAGAVVVAGGTGDAVELAAAQAGIGEELATDIGGGLGLAGPTDSACEDGRDHRASHPRHGTT